VDYIPILELVEVTVGGFILVGTIRGVRAGEVHFPIQWLFERGYVREDARFKWIVIANLAIAATLFTMAATHLVLLY